MENYENWENIWNIWEIDGQLWKIVENLDPFSGLMWIKLVEHDVIYLNHPNLEVCRLQL